MDPASFVIGVIVGALAGGVATFLFLLWMAFRGDL